MRINRRSLRWRRHKGRPTGALGDAGQALVEVAIALPILLALLVGIFEFARAYNVQQVITHAAREGARHGVVEASAAAEAQTRATLRLADGNISGATVTATCSPCGTGDELRVQVTVPYTFVFVGPVLSLFSSGADPGTINLSSTATMRIE